MLKIKQIDFIKVVYDDSLSHHIFSIANITFSNYEPISGALLYWQRNDDEEEYTAEGDYKFFYDMANVTYFASVKFPKHVRLTRDQKQELAYILLEERGSIGSYSFSSHKSRKRFNIAKQYELIKFPEDFDCHKIEATKDQLTMKEVLDLQEKYSPYSKRFVRQYLQWRTHAAKLHPEDLQHYLHAISFEQLCYTNPYLSEQFLIENLAELSPLLQYNKPVLNRLSKSFKQYFIDYLQRRNIPIHAPFAHDISKFLDTAHYYDHEPVYYFDEIEEEEVKLHFFEYDTGVNKWQGSEHLIKGIPSLASQQYDEYGFKRKTNKEMDAIFSSFTEEQYDLIGAVLQPHWLHRYKNELNWSVVCRENPYLTEDFILAHLKFIDFEALGEHPSCLLSEKFMMKYMGRFNHERPVPLVLRHLTVPLYESYKDTIKVDLQLLEEYRDSIEEDQLKELQKLLAQ